MKTEARRFSPAEGVCRLALLQPERVEMAHPSIPGARIVGYVIEPDELYKDNEGLDLLGALEKVARVNWSKLRTRLLALPED